MAQPDWADFNLVLALARGGSVAGAARILGVDNSTVSRRLAAMEKALGACLVLRGGREFAFTSEGKAALAAAESIETIIADATTSIRSAKTEIEGVVRVSVVPSLLRTLMPLAPLATERFPGLSIELNAVQRIVDLAKGEADIALRMAQPREIDLVARRAFEMGLGVYASKSYADRCGLPARPEDLCQHRLIQYSQNMLHLPWFGWIEAYADKAAPATRADSTEMATGLIAAGNGIGVLTCYAGDASPDLVRVFPEPVGTAIGWIVYHEAARNSARVRAVVDLLAEFLDTLRGELSGRH
jgi:DNA-binding transcriptional LysR family regulator